MKIIEPVENPTFSASDFSRHNKRPGISCIVRLKNEQEYVKAALESIEPFVDEMIIVLNRCTDRTPEIIAEYAARHPRRVRAYDYMPEVAPLGTDAHRATPVQSPHSFVFYTNFALSKASCLVRIPWDGDHIALGQRFAPVVERLTRMKRGTIERYLSPYGVGYWSYTGINLWNDHGHVLVHRSLPLAGPRRENGFFPAGRLVRYKRYTHGEYLFKRFLLHRPLGVLFYHLKGMKRDRGVNKYELDRNPGSSYQERVATRWINPQLMTLDELIAANPGLSDLPDPASIGIRVNPER